MASGRQADGPAPATLPRDREEGPAALDDVATTAAGQRHGESLEDRLAQEEPDVPLAAATADRPLDDPDRVRLGEDHEPASLSTMPGEGRVGRLVQPDQGAHTDTEPAEVAEDAGAAGGGPSAEELAMHEVPEE